MAKEEISDAKRNKIWLHRISHEMAVSYPLLERGYLSIGFSELAKDQAFVSEMRQNHDAAHKLKSIENACLRSVYGEFGRSRHNLLRFLDSFSVDDIVLIPSWGKLYLCKIKGSFQTAASVEIPGLKDWNGKPVLSDGVQLLCDGRSVDIGFLLEVEQICDPIERAKYADNALTSRMKIRQTNADISDLRNSTERIIDLVRMGKTLSYHGEIITELQKNLLDVTKKNLTPKKFEMAIKWYLSRIGADSAYIPDQPTDAAKERNGADADIIAIFEALQVVICVQAKFHDGETSDWSVKQINEYYEQKYAKNEAEGDNGYTYIPWVISTCDHFSDAAARLAQEKNVRLINGMEFAKMLIDVGFGNIDKAFEKE